MNIEKKYLKLAFMKCYFWDNYIKTFNTYQKCMELIFIDLAKMFG